MRVEPIKQPSPVVFTRRPEESNKLLSVIFIPGQEDKGDVLIFNGKIIRI